VVFSTNPDFNYNIDEPKEDETLLPSKQKLRVAIERKGRGGKVVTIVNGFVGTTDDLKNLEKMLKSKCGVGGSTKDGSILLQGDLKAKVVLLLKDLGYSDTK
jgi:translation initiation factor 1